MSEQVEPITPDERDLIRHIAGWMEVCIHPGVRWEWLRHWKHNADYTGGAYTWTVGAEPKTGDPSKGTGPSLQSAFDRFKATRNASEDTQPVTATPNNGENDE